MKVNRIFIEGRGMRLPGYGNEPALLETTILASSEVAIDYDPRTQLVTVTRNKCTRSIPASKCFEIDLAPEPAAK